MIKDGERILINTTNTTRTLMRPIIGISSDDYTLHVGIGRIGIYCEVD